MHPLSTVSHPPRVDDRLGMIGVVHVQWAYSRQILVPSKCDRGMYANKVNSRPPNRRCWIIEIRDGEAGQT